MAYKMIYAKADEDSEIDGGYYIEWTEESFEKVERKVKRFKRDHPGAHVSPICLGEQKIGEMIDYFGITYACTLEYYEFEAG